MLRYLSSTFLKYFIFTFHSQSTGHFFTFASLRPSFQIPPPPQQKKNTNPFGLVFFFWRRRRDLNPRYPFGVYTISNRARSASYATSPYHLQFVSRSRLAYNTSCFAICQALFYIFSIHFSGKQACCFPFTVLRTAPEQQGIFPRTKKKTPSEWMGFLAEKEGFELLGCFILHPF